MVIFEGPHKLPGTIEDLATALGGERRAAVVREMTKIYEEVISGSLAELTERFAKSSVKGEIVIVVEGAESEEKRRKKNLQ
jgi:16S rRNA (cytidine1402-2'-O)-methyltransferase